MNIENIILIPWILLILVGYYSFYSFLSFFGGVGGWDMTHFTIHNELKMGR